MSGVVGSGTGISVIKVVVNVRVGASCVGGSRGRFWAVGTFWSHDRRAATVLT